MSSRATTWDRSHALRVGMRPACCFVLCTWALAFPSVPLPGGADGLPVSAARPDLYYADRIAFGVLVFFVAPATLALRDDRIPFLPGLSLPMLGLVGSRNVARALREPFDAQIWSIVASKFIVPFALFHLAMLVFRGASQRKHFEIFVILALAYLVFTAIAFLVDARVLIFPRFILDESLGVQAERARGPFLQAVANGVSLNILGILAIAFAQKRKTIVLAALAGSAAGRSGYHDPRGLDLVRGLHCRSRISAASSALLAARLPRSRGGRTPGRRWQSA